MNIPSKQRKPVVALLFAVAGATPWVAGAQSLVPEAAAHSGTGQMVAAATVSNSTNAGHATEWGLNHPANPAASMPVKAMDQPPPPDVGPNPGDRLRSEMQSHVHHFNELGLHG